MILRLSFSLPSVYVFFYHCCCSVLVHTLTNPGMLSRQPRHNWFRYQDCQQEKLGRVASVLSPLLLSYIIAAVLCGFVQSQIWDL